MGCRALLSKCARASTVTPLQQFFQLDEKQYDALSKDENKPLACLGSTPLAYCAANAQHRALKALVEKKDPHLLQCGLTRAVADDGTVEWVRADVLPRFKAEGRSALRCVAARA